MATVKLLTWEDSDSHPDLVLRQGMRSTSTTVNGDGYGAPTRIDTVSEYNIDSLNGVNPGFVATAGQPRGMRYDVSGNNLEDAHYYHIEVSREHFENDTSQSNYFISNGSGGIDHRPGSNHDCFMGTEPGANADYDNCRAEISYFGKSNTVNIDIMCTAIDGEQRYFVDGLECNPATFNGGDVPPLEGNYGDFYAAGLTSLQSDWRGDTSASSNEFFFRNFFILDTPIVPDYDDDKSVLHLGDSLTVEGSMSPWYGLPNGTKRAPWVPTADDAVGTDYGSGFAAGGVNAAGPSNYKDAGCVPSFYRFLAKQDTPIRPSGVNSTIGNNGNYAVSGGALSTAQTKFTQAVAAGYQPTIVVCGIGTNDVTAFTSPATFESDYKSLIDDAIANGAQQFIAWTIISLRNDPTYQTTAYDTQTDDLNAKIRGLNGYRGVVKVVDCFNLFTPNHATNPNDFRAVGNIHPSEELSNQLGSSMGAGYVALLQDQASGLAGFGIMQPIMASGY